MPAPMSTASIATTMEKGRRSARCTRCIQVSSVPLAGDVTAAEFRVRAASEAFERHPLLPRPHAATIRRTIILVLEKRYRKSISEVAEQLFGSVRQFGELVPFADFVEQFVKPRAHHSQGFPTLCRCTVEAPIGLARTLLVGLQVTFLF